MELKMNLRFFIIGMAAVLAWNVGAAEPWTLDRAIGYALTNSPDARIAQQRIAAAQAQLGQANAAFSPRLQLGSSYTRTDNPMQVFGSILNQRSFGPSLNFNDVPDIDDANAKGLVTMPLYAGGRNVAARDAAKANTKASRLDAKATRNNLAFEVARAFHTVIKTREFVRATEAGVRDFETNADFATKRFNAGTLLKPDVLDVEVRLAQAREELIRARNANQLATRALRNLLGIEQGEFAIVDSAPDAGDLPELTDFSRRPELAASRYRQDVAQADFRRAASGYKPRVSAFGSLDYNYGTRTGGDGASYTGGVLLQWDLWDGFLTRSKRAEARANIEMTREEDRKLRLTLDFELEQARIALREATERLEVTQKAIGQAKESVFSTGPGLTKAWPQLPS